MRGNATLIAGPTASGKSAMALEIARERDGVIINADSMQVYDVLQILTARPCESEMGGVGHYLFGHVHPSQHYSVGRWIEDVSSLLAKPWIGERHLVFVGGTGMYFKAVLGGLSPMPEIPGDVRSLWRARLEEAGPEALHTELQMRDAETAARLKPQDGQRIVRAIEVFEASGETIGTWQARNGKALIGGSHAQKICVLPEREAVRARIDARFRAMVKGGALDEVRALLALNLDPFLPSMKAIGVSELGAYLRGKTDLDTAIERASAATRQYAKRQTTWLRHQFGADWEIRQTTGADR
jgi:tRNA dimethylallyltransferase